MEEEKKTVDVGEQNQTGSDKKQPLGVIVLANINIIFNGIIPLLLVISPPGLEPLFIKLKGIVDAKIDFAQVKSILVILQTIVSIIFVTSGIGLFLRKEWARKATLYFAVFLTVAAALSVFVNTSLLPHAFLQVIYPGVLIVYFTNKKVESYFKE